VRRLQTPIEGQYGSHLLPAGGLVFRGSYPQADFRVQDPDSPVSVLWSAFAPVIPYDFDASALPLIFFALQVSNHGDTPVDVSTLFNWQNTCGQSSLNVPEDLAPAGTEVIITDAEWDRMTNRRQGDNERRLSASSGRLETSKRRVYAAGEVPTNALVFGDPGEIDANEDGQHCVVSPWSDAYSTSLAFWDPEDGASAERFWSQWTRDGQLNPFDNSAPARAGAVSNRFTLAPGESKRVEYVVSWYCPRYVTTGPDEGNFYANNYEDARAIARIGLDNRQYFHASVSAWQKRIVAMGHPPEFVRGLFSGLEVLSTNAIHSRDGEFGLVQSMADPRVNHLRDRWFWSIGLLLLFPRFELETLDRLGESTESEDGRTIRISEGLESFIGGEFVGPGALQVEACAALVTLACRNYLLGGNRSAVAQLAPRLQSLMAAQLAQDKDLDGFPDIQHESPGLDGQFASGLNAITAGLWIVTLRAYERLARQQHYAEADLYKKAYERAARSFDKYFWEREAGYYTLYPNPALGLVPENPLSSACHIGQLYPIWVADVLELFDAFPRKRVARLMETLEQRNVRQDRILMLGADPGETPSPDGVEEREASAIYAILPYLCLKSRYEPDAPVHALVCTYLQGIGQQRESAQAAPWADAERHIAQLALWYLVAPLPEALLNLAERRLELRPGITRAGTPRSHTLCTPNGFGDVSVEIKSLSPFRCEVAFKMDIPQEIGSVSLTVAAALEEVRCRLIVDDEAIAVKSSLEHLGASEVCILIRPEHKLSTPAFTLHVDASSQPSKSKASKRQWIPQWFRR